MKMKENLISNNLLILTPLIFGGFTIVYGMGNSVWPMVFSSYLAYLLFPFIRKLESKGVHRTLASLGVFFCFFIAFLIFLGILVPLLTKDFRQFIAELPEVFEKITDQIEALGASFGLQWVIDKAHIKNILASGLNNLTVQSFQSATGVVTKALVSFRGFLTFAMNLFLLPIFFYFLVNDFERVQEELKSLVPPRWNPFFRRFLTQANDVFKGYLQGQLTVAIVLAVLYSLALYFVGIRFGVLIGCMTGILIFIPFVGVGLGFAFSFIMALTDLSSQKSLVGGVILVFVIIPLIEQYILTPRLVGGKVGLNSLETIIALIVGGNLAGFLGMIVAIPCWAIAKLIYVELKREYINTNVFKGC